MASSNESVTIQLDKENIKQAPPPQYQPLIGNGGPPTTSQQGLASFNSASQQLTLEPPPVGNVVNYNRNPYSVMINEPPEAAVSRPLAVIALFCWCQIWFSIPAAVFAFKRNKPRSNYNKSIALSLTAIVVGMFIAFVVMYVAVSGGGKSRLWH